MARKPVTYGRKRNRNVRKPVLQTQSSPISAIINPDEEMATSGKSRQMLKRSRQSWSANATDRIESTEQLPKKPKLDSHHVYESPQATTAIDQKGLQTPHNTRLTREQVFKLESSRGGTPQSEECEMSPVPLALPLGSSNKQTTRTVNRTRLYLRKTSSSNLKENTIPSLPKSSSNSRPSSSGSTGVQSSFKRMAKLNPKTSTRGVSLASPFASKPSSPQPTSRLTLPSQVEPQQQDPKTSLKRTLSDTHFNPNLPSNRIQSLAQAHSTTSSPTSRYEDESIKARRPSAPSATSQRPDVTSWFPSYSSGLNFRDQVLSSSADFFVSGFRSRDFAIDFNRPPSQLSCNLDYDEAFFGDALEVSTPFKLKGQRSASLISADSPDLVEESSLDKTLDSHSIYSSDMHLTRPLSLNPDIFGSWVSDSLISSPTLSQSAYDVTKLESLVRPLEKEQSSLSYVEVPEQLQDLFDKLELKTDGNPAPIRSLDLENDQSLVGRSLQSPARISHSQTKQVIVEPVIEKRTGRDRRGTIRASDFPVAGSSVLAGPRRTRSGTVVQSSARPRRERSDTIVARPSNPVSSKCAPPPLTRVDDVDMSNSAGDVGCQEIVDVLMSTTEEQEDELALKGHWIDEDWVVAAPPSPVLPRRKRKAIADWRRRYEQKKALGIWGGDHDPDDGEDDPLLLK